VPDEDAHGEDATGRGRRYSILSPPSIPNEGLSGDTYGKLRRLVTVRLKDLWCTQLHLGIHLPEYRLSPEAAPV
jgi:hypothetical protein